MNRKNYTCLIPFPKGGGHYAAKGETFDLLDVQASALRTAGRIDLTDVLAAAATSDAAQVPEAVPVAGKTQKAATAAAKEA